MIPGPYVLVGASLGGIYVRRFFQRFPDPVAGIVLVDSSHEEQYSYYAAISPALPERYATQDGRFDRNDFLRSAGQLESGKRLECHLLQLDLASRSKFGKLIETESGHLMAVERQQIIVESIRDVIRQATMLKKP